MDNKPLTDWEKWQQAEALLREMGLNCAGMSGDIHDLREELAAPGMPFKIEGGWKIRVGNTVGLGATPGDAIDAAFEALHGNLMDRAIEAETCIAAATERATALSRAGLGTTEPWAQAGQVLACLRGEDVPAVVLIPADDWVPVTERLPEECGDVLVTVYDRDGKAYIEMAYMIRDLDGVVWWMRDGRAVPDATHWRFVPAPPVVSKTERSDGNA